MNDHSIQRYSLGWEDVTSAISKMFKKKIEKSDVDFSDNLLSNAIEAVESTEGYEKDDKILSLMKAFARELNINMETMRDKYKK